MAPQKSSFLDKVLGRIGRLDTEGLHAVLQRLARERAFLETLFNIIEDGVLVVDEDGRIIYFNQAVTQLLGLPAAADGEPISRYLPELDWARLATMDREGGDQVVRHEFEVSYPRPRFLRLYAAPLDGHENTTSGMALVLHDATEARQKTFEAIESERLQALTLLAASVAHEIGNPLNALHIHLQLMERELRKLRSATPRVREQPRRSPLRRGRAGVADSSEESGDDPARRLDRIHRYLEVAKGEISRLDYIVTQFLQAIRPSEPNFELSSLNDAAEKSIQLLLPELDNRGITVNHEFNRGLPATFIDPVQIQQALLNLIKNAMHAMTRGGVLTLQTGSNPDTVWVAVADTGGGISREKIKHIFEPYFTTKKKGTGLGLMIVQRIVRAHGGRIEVESHLGRGTCFRIWLPRHERQPRLLEARLNG